MPWRRQSRKSSSEPGPRASTWAFALGPRLKLQDPRFEFGELGLRALEELFLHLEILAQNQVEPVEPCREQRPQVALDVLRRRIAQRLANPLVQLLEQPFIDHGSKASSACAPVSGGRRASVHCLWAPPIPALCNPLMNKRKTSGTGDAMESAATPLPI